MNRINSERSEEKDFTDGTTKRRISSILKAPRTPLRDLGNGNELIQEGIVEKCQKTSRRVSFADTIRVFPPDSQTTVELNHAELIGEPRHHQKAFPEKDDLEVVPCEITGMNTLLNAPIQTPLQQMEVFDAYSCPERNKMDKTFIFLAENEMDMTYDHTIMITHDVRDCQESDKSGKIDFKSFSTELKSKKETSQVNEASFFSCPTMMNDTCLSQHKIDTENRHKINFGDFLQSLKSIKQLPTPTDEMVASNNVLQEKTYNAITVSRQLDDNRQNYIMPVLANKNSVMFASKHLEFQEITPAAGKESVEMFIPNREMGLPLGASLDNIVNEQENLRRDHSVNCNTNSSRLNASNFRLAIQQEPSKCINEKGVNHTEASAEQKDTIMVTKSDTSQPHNRTDAMSVPIVSATSMAAQPEATTTMFSSCMELTNNGTNLIWDGNSTRMGCPFHGDPEKQKNDVFQLEKATCRENHVNISVNSFPKSTQLSIFCNEKAAPNQEFTYNNAELLSTRINPAPQVPYLPEKETYCFPGEEPSRSSVIFPKNRSSNSNFVSKKQTASQFLSLSDMAQTSAVHSKINRLSSSAVSLVPEDKTATFIFSEDMEITKCTTKLSSNNPDSVVFNKLQCGRLSQAFSSQPIDKTVYICDNMDETKAITGIIYQPMESVNGTDMRKQTNESVRRTLTGSNKERSTVFLHSDENRMEITRSYTVPLNHDAIIQGEKIPITSFVPANKMDVFAVDKDRDITEPIGSLTDKSLRSVTDSFAVLESKAKTDKKTRGLAGGIVYSVNEDNDMEFTKSLTGIIEGGPQTLSPTPPEKALSLHCSGIATCKSVPFVPLDKTVFFLHNNDMETAKPVACGSTQDSDPKNLEWNMQESGKVIVSETAKEELTPQLHEICDMEITRSHDILLQPQLTTQGSISGLVDKTNTPANSNSAIALSTSFVPIDKTMLFMDNNDMEITNSVSEVILRNSNLTSLSQAGQETREIKLPSLVKDKTSVTLHDDEMEITKCHTVAVNADMYPKCGNTPANSNSAITLSTSYVPVDKITMLMDNNDMEITKSVSEVVLKNSNLASLSQEGQKTRESTFACLVKDKTSVTLRDDEMEITKCHTVAVNTDMLPECGNTHANSNPAITLATSYVPVDKAMLLMDNNDVEITKSVSEVILKNSNLASLTQEGQKTRESTLAGLVIDKTSVTVHDDEMESRKHHTAAVNYDMLPKCEKNPLKLCCQEDMGISGSHTVNENTKELHKTSTKLGKHSEWNLSSKHMVEFAMGDDKEGSKRHKLGFDCERSLHYLPASHAKFPLSVSETNEFTSYQDGTEVINLPPNAVDNQDLEESVTQEMPERNTEQHLINVLPLVYGGKTQDTEFAENHTINIYGYGSNNDVSNSESQIQNIFTESRGAENLEMTNYTTGTERMHMNKTKCYLNSQDKSNSEFSALAVTCEKKLDIAETEKAKYSICSATGMLVISQGHQNFLKITDNQLKSCTSKIYNFGKDTSISSSKDDGEKIPWPRQKPTEETSDLLDDGKVTNRNEATSGEWSSCTKDWQNNVKSSPINTFPSEEKPIILSKISGVANSSFKLKDTGKKSPPVLLSQTVESCLGDSLPEFTVKSDNPSVLKEDAEDSNTPKEWTNTGFTETASIKVPLSTVFTENSKIKKMPLGIFPPKLPNKRKSLYYADNIDVRSEKRKISQSGKNIGNLSPSSYINEELLPAYVEGMDSDESLNCDVLENVCEEMNGKEAAEKEGYFSKTYESGKRPRDLIQEDEELQKEKLFKGNQDWNNITDFKQPLTSTMVAHSQAPTHEDKNVPEVTVINLEKTGSSNSSSLDSVQRNTELETQLLLDNICEQNLREKLQDGTITVREFFTLLEVHVLIQKPRQSQLPLKYEVNTTPTLEDEILSQYLFHPKLQTYEEDCQCLCKIIEELKSHAVDQDKILINVHKSFWEVMRTCSDEELKGFGAELNKMKSCFTKKSKVLAHRGKANLYAKLVQSAQFQWENLQSRLTKIDELLKETDSCLVALEKETAALEEHELEFCSVTSEYETKLRNTERELENLRVQDETLKRAQSNFRDKKEQVVSEIYHTQKDVKSCQELVEKYKYSFSAWVIKEWTDHQAVFTFLYDSIELTVGLECSAGDALCSNKIVSVNFESLLDEAKALPSAKLAHRLIFQFINSQGSWKEKCLMVPDLSQMLHDVSLVVSRCQNLRDEIEFLNKWGGKYYLLKTELNDTKLKLLFSGFRAKFEIEVSLSASYPMSPVTFTIQKCTGNLLYPFSDFSQEEISEVLSNVPVGVNYLKRLVKQISDSLFQRPPSRPSSS